MLSVTDPLTGLLNRKGFDEELHIIIGEHSDISCVGIQMDIDDFKAIPHNYCRAIAQSDFSSDCIMRTTQGCRLARTNCAR